MNDLEARARAMFRKELGSVVTSPAECEEAAIRAIVTALATPAGYGWRPIAEAPRDGEPVLIWKPDERMVGEYMMSAYWADDQSGFVPVGGVHKQGYHSAVTDSPQGYPTHWRPLPAPPASIGEG